MTTGIDLIEADHRRVEALFAQYERDGQALVAGQIFAELTAHDEAETGALYPLVSALVSAEAADDALLAHAKVKMGIERARALEGGALHEAVMLLRDEVLAHVADEEQSLLPKLAEAADEAQLTGLAARIEQIKQRVG
jgi:hemerythrin superfamily protein